ncbi:uncharacterized protein V6R79_013734 [Siganus canaliculatus]
MRPQRVSLDPVNEEQRQQAMEPGPERTVAASPSIKPAPVFVLHFTAAPLSLRRPERRDEEGASRRTRRESAV